MGRVHMRLAITELTEPCLTRKRGGLAAQELLSRDEGREVRLVLNGTEFLSLSFLDELVRRLHDAGVLGRLTFETNRGEHLEKLGRVRDVRGVDIYTVVDDERVLVDLKPGLNLTEAAATDQPPQEPKDPH